MWTPGIVLARFAEAAFTERFLPSAKMPSAAGYWPQFIHDAEDVKGWDDQARLDNAQRKTGRASSGAISRHQECLDWTATRIHDEMRRHIVWTWAFCHANGWSFRTRCAKRGWPRSTAYNRLTSTIEAISVDLGKARTLLHLPDGRWLRHESEDDVDVCGTVNNCAIAPAASKPLAFLSEKPRDLLKTEDDFASFAKHVERTNARRRKLQQWRDEVLDAEVA